MKVTKFKKVDAPLEFKEKGIVAFQVVKFTFEYFGKQLECEHDTKIMQDGKQYVIGGDGFIREGFEVPNDPI